MPSAAQDPVFFAYAAASVVTILNCMVLWTLSGIVRGKVKATTNPEDAAAFKMALTDSEPAEVLRVLRVHRNTADNTYCFLFLGLVFIHLGPSALEAQILFGAFTGFRLGFSVFYLKGVQPWRTICYALGLLTTLALIGDICRLLLA